MFNVLQPEGWTPAKGYANGIEASGRMVFVAGMSGWNGQAPPERIHAAYQLALDDYRGRSGVQLLLSHWQPA